jgi:hypothetical protein
MPVQANFERDQESGAFEVQYKKLVDEIQVIYDNAKEFHGKVREPAVWAAMAAGSKCGRRNASNLPAHTGWPGG